MKRVFDVTVAAVTLIALLPVFLVVALIVLVREGRPIFYVSERMKTPTAWMNCPNCSTSCAAT